MTSDVDVAWHDASVDAGVALAGHVDRLMGRSGAVTSGRLCGACGSDRHGRPWLRHDGVVVHVSLARSGPHLVTVVAQAPVGVDVEVAVIDVAPALVLAAGEDEDLARTWARKEAVLKAYGTGLVVSMADVHLDRERWRDLAAPEGFVAAVAFAPPKV
ncbi:4'-phosphopantetheinyl transferase superfamily protein [Nocardioides glacieisoli]|uniref:4'-phosphopantetheinyl transferase superfamily protein n=1 Tax=Nocardioides glacieisoli TaxID=1168730 RepID=A0A4Q2S2U4_9ACTN|nr:4'-phosphopantetheinyl transferase superfamily protein [Nocardioides glacieisoli]RYB96040.1 4'-phosphopantetheinyl transferase superfamily protein [Nocardioides glacieisoli]